jgi:hypothetical protein
LIRAFTIIVLLFFTLAHAETRITWDMGGPIAIYQDRVAHAKGPIIIDGPCNSACTLYLSRPDICVTPRASFGFHTVRIPETGEELSGYSATLLAAYPPSILKWLARNGGLKYVFTNLMGEELQNLLPHCS